MAACDASRKFIFFSWGGEGSAHDATVLFNSEEYKTWPQGCYMLFDAGNTCQFGKVLSPYKGVAYHLAEIQPTRGPLSRKELFNLRHSVKRSGAIECAFGILKLRCAILRKGFKANRARTDCIMHVSFNLVYRECFICFCSSLRCCTTSSSITMASRTWLMQPASLILSLPSWPVTLNRNRKQARALNPGVTRSQTECTPTILHVCLGVVVLTGMTLWKWQHKFKTLGGSRLKLC